MPRGRTFSRYIAEFDSRSATVRRDLKPKREQDERRRAFDNPPSHEAALEERVRRLEQRVGRLTLENAFLKSRAAKPRTSEEMRRFIGEHRDLVQSVERGCERMNLPRSAYYME
jgi:hypothetical protein